MLIPLAKTWKKGIVKVVKAFKDKDAATLNKMIHKDHKLTVIFRSGVFNEYTTTDNMGFDKPVPRNWTYPEVKTIPGLKYETLPDYSCDTEKWSKQGLYCNTEARSKLLSKTAHNLKVYAEVDIAQEVIDNFKALESKSHRVVFINGDTALIFYLTLIDNTWYLNRFGQGIRRLQRLAYCKRS